MTAAYALDYDGRDMAALFGTAPSQKPRVVERAWLGILGWAAKPPENAGTRAHPLSSANARSGRRACPTDHQPTSRVARHACPTDYQPTSRLARHAGTTAPFPSRCSATAARSRAHPQPEGPPATRRPTRNPTAERSLPVRSLRLKSLQGQRHQPIEHLRPGEPPPRPSAATCPPAWGPRRGRAPASRAARSARGRSGRGRPGAGPERPGRRGRRRPRARRSPTARAAAS